MKLKYLFSASAMLALMAACSNEVETLTNETVADRPSAGQVEIVSTFGDADSRASWTGAGWKFNEETDRFGVMLMDTWNQTNEGQTTIDDYTFVDYIHTNYPFHSEDGGYTWQSPENAPLSEGNYFFTFPFDPTYQHRGRVYFEVPNVQSNVTEAGVVDAAWPIKYYQKYLGYAFIPAQSGVNKVDVSFHPLFANPKFKIMNATGMNIRMIKMLVRTHQDGKAGRPNQDCEGGQPELMPTKLQLAPLSAGFDRVNNDYAAGELSGAEETAVLFSHATTVENGFFGENKLDGVYEYVLDCGDNYVVPAGEFFRLSAVMPAGQYWNFDIYAFVEIQNSEKTTGVIRLTGIDKSNWSNMDTQNGSMQTVLKPGITQVLTASFDANSVANLGLKDFTVVTSEDLAFVVDLKAKDGGRDLVIIKTLGDDVVLTKEVYDLISDVNRKGIKWQIDGTIVIPADAAADAIDQLTTGEGDVKTTIINKGTQVLTKDLEDCDVINEGTITEAENVDVTIYGNVTVESGKVEVTGIEGCEVAVAEGAELTAKTIEAEESVDNAGTLKAESVETETFVNSGVATVVTIDAVNVQNSNSLTVNNVTGTIDNIGVLDAMGGTLNGVFNGGLQPATINIKGETSIVKLVNNVEGIVNVDANATIQSGDNYGRIEVAEGIYLKATIALNNHDDATINVKGELVEIIKNSGLINVIGKGHVVVNGKIEKEVNGIIDVTLATEHAAKDNGNNTNYFRYIVGTETTATALETSLKARISAENWGDDKNAIILVWGANSATTFGGNVTANVERVIIENTLTINDNTSFCELNNLDWTETTTSMTGATITAATNKAIWVKGRLIVANDKTLSVVAGENNYEKDGTSPSEVLMICVDGKLRAENHGAVAGTAKVEGSGIVENDGASFAWTKASTWAGASWIGF